MPKKTKNKRTPIKKSSFYTEKDGKAEKSKIACPKCGPGVFMADHKDRQACGKCNYTQWKK